MLLKEFKMYLAGACNGLPDLGTKWRREATKYFKNYCEMFPQYRIVTYDPTHYFARDGSDSVSNKQVKNFYLKYLIKNCDVVLVNLNQTETSMGTAQELQFSVDHDIPVVGYGYDNVYEWLPEDCDVVFDNLNHAMEYITDNFIFSI